VVPTTLDPAVWMVHLAQLPRPAATVVLLACLALLVMGLRWLRYFLIVGAMVAAAGGGNWLAGLMHVNGWFVAVPAAVAGGALGFFITPLIRFVAVAFGCACGTGVLVVWGMELPGFLAAFLVGALVGVAFSALAPRFSGALLAVTVGTLGAISTLGTALGVRYGGLAAGAYRVYPTSYGIAAGAILLVSLIVQLARDPVNRGAITEEHPT
jgi:hypothetical protein